MEKENRRARDDARREYNDVVRVGRDDLSRTAGSSSLRFRQSLASFLKKRDPRFLNSASVDPLKAKALEAERLRTELRQVALKRAEEREREAREYKAPAWQNSGTNANTDDMGEEEDQNSAGDEDEEIWCAACEKGFQSENAWVNHERSKKHLKAVQRYSWIVYCA